MWSQRAHILYRSTVIRLAATRGWWVNGISGSAVNAYCVSANVCSTEKYWREHEHGHAHAGWPLSHPGIGHVKSTRNRTTDDERFAKLQGQLIQKTNIQNTSRNVVSTWKQRIIQCQSLWLPHRINLRGLWSLFCISVSVFIMIIRISVCAPCAYALSVLRPARSVVDSVALTTKLFLNCAGKKSYLMRGCRMNLFLIN